MKTFIKAGLRLAIVVVIGGFLGASLVRWAPGYGVSENELDSRLNAESMQALRQSQNTGESLPSFYLHYWGKLLRGDFGFSNSMGEPVRQLLAERFPETLKGVAFGLAMGWFFGLGFAILSTTTRLLVVDLGAGMLATIALCTPVAAVALLCVITQTPGRIGIAVVVFPKVFQYSRNLLLRTAALPHIVTANAKGLGNTSILLRHILPVAAPQLLALAGVTVSLAFTAAIPVEALCDIPGIGQLAWKAALARDLELLVILTMIVTAITLVANSAAELAGRATAEGRL